MKILETLTPYILTGYIPNSVIRSKLKPPQREPLHRKLERRWKVKPVGFVPGPEVIKLFMLNSAEHENDHAHKCVKMLGILTFISMIKEAQWLSGRVLVSRGFGFESHQCHILEQDTLNLC